MIHKNNENRIISCNLRKDSRKKNASAIEKADSKAYNTEQGFAVLFRSGAAALPY